MKKLLQKSALFLFLGVSVICLNAQSLSVTLDLPSTNIIHSRSRLMDDGSVVSIVYDPNALASHVVMITPDGTTNWAKVYQGIRIDDVKQLPSGNLAIAGTKDYYYSVWGILDQNGNQIWAKQYYNYQSNYDLASVDLLASGKILYSFSKYSKSMTIRCDEGGNTEDCDEGEDTLGMGKNPRFDSFGCDDSGYVGCNKSDDRIMLVRHNASGDVMWAKNYMKSTSEYFHLKKIQELSDGNFMAVGLVSDTYTGPNNNGFIIKMDSDGEVLWTKKYTFPPNPGYFTSTFRSFEIEGSFIYISGYYTTDGMIMNNFLMKLDDNGNVITSKQMVTSSNLMTIFSTPSMGTVSFEHDMKDHYLVYNNYTNGGGYLNVEINKVNFDGELGCEVTDFPVTAISYSAIDNTQPAAYTQTSILDTAPGDIISVSLVITNSTIGMNDACASIAGIEEASEYGLVVYPNPASEMLMISGLNKEANYEIQMIDLSGRVVYTKTGINGVEMTAVSVDGFANGLYVANIINLSANLSTQLKWVKM